MSELVNQLEQIKLTNKDKDYEKRLIDSHMHFIFIFPLMLLFIDFPLFVCRVCTFYQNMWMWTSQQTNTWNDGSIWLISCAIWPMPFAIYRNHRKFLAQCSKVCVILSNISFVIHRFSRRICVAWISSSGLISSINYRNAHEHSRFVLSFLHSYFINNNLIQLWSHIYTLSWSVCFMNFMPC